MEPITVNITDLLRDPKEILAELPKREVLLRRQKGPDVLLVDAAREQAVRQTLMLSLAALAVGLMEGTARAGFSQGLPVLLPWTKYLSSEERLAFLDEWAATARSSFDLDDFSQVARLLDEWRTTARVYSTDDTSREALEPLVEEPDAQAPLERPTADMAEALEAASAAGDSSLEAKASGEMAEAL